MQVMLSHGNVSEHVGRLNGQQGRPYSRLRQLLGRPLPWTLGILSDTPTIPIHFALGKSVLLMELFDQVKNERIESRQ
jgi:hypothetical protein